MSATLQLEKEEVTQLHDAPRLLVEWSSPWDEFVTSIRPALSRSTARLAGEAPFGLIPLRIMLSACGLELFLIFLAVIVPIKLAQLQPYLPPKLTGHDVIYYSGDELPRTEDLGGTHAGASGRAGGTEAHHHTQTIKVARGGSLVEKVLDAPKIKLAPSAGPVANLLAIRPDAGPPPTEGLRSSRTQPNLPSSVVAPAPSLTTDLSRAAVSLGAVIPPAPSVSRDRILMAPALNSRVVPPAPRISSDRTRTLPTMSTNVIPPSPDVSRDRALITPSLNTSVVAPAPNLPRDASRDQSRSAPALNSSVVPPAPTTFNPDSSRSPVQMANAAVVPPPVSAPEREGRRNPKLAMPAPSVIAPPPSADVQDTHRLAGGSVPDVAKTVVAPPPTPAASTSFMGSLLDRVFGSPAVVAPPPTMADSSLSRTAGGSLTAQVVPPPPAVGSSGARAGINRIAIGAGVVPPPPSVAGSTLPGGRSSVANPAPSPAVVLPPPTVSGAGGPRANQLSGLASTALARSVVPPPPSLGKADGLTGSGRGSSGPGLGAPLDAGAVVAPPRSSGSGADSGVVVSKDPGPKVGLPANARPGSIAMSPAGGEKPGLGGSGGGSGMVRGEGPGSGMIAGGANGAGSGGGKAGTGHGSDPAAKAGISPTPGPGGAGNATAGTPAVPGVSVAGGSSIVTVDFGSNVGSGNPSLPGRSSVKEQHSLRVSIQSTASSGGAFGYYHLLAGATHDIYIDNSPLPAVMTYSEPTPTRGTAGALTNPEPIHAELPAGLPHVRLVVTCVLDTSGNLKNLRVLDAGPPEMTAKVLAALPSWKFSPVMIGNQPVEVNAILGFNIDTNDRR
ncbi:MAG TPA: energy transducer TonB [Candidatus Sulfotelmatobacter sp.]|nr:energy transducer TonB [Candidatus Sulfotelmatobacter sp.]